jgi:hypothetical protein
MAKRKSAFEKLVMLAIKESVKASKARKKQASTLLSAPISEDNFYITAGEINYLEPPDEYVELRTYLDGYSYPVSGESFQTASFLEISRMFPGETEVFVDVLLVPFPENPVDKHAVAVTYENMMLGYVPRYVAREFSEYLGDDCGKCRARIFLDRPDYVRCSVELNLMYPPTAIWEDQSQAVPELGALKPIYSFKKVSTDSATLKKIALQPGVPHFGWAYLNQEYTSEPWIQDCETLEEIGKPIDDLSWAFNVFCRAHGGQVKVRYKLLLEPNGKLQLILDSTGLATLNRRIYS